MSIPNLIFKVPTYYSYNDSYELDIGLYAQ